VLFVRSFVLNGAPSCHAAHVIDVRLSPFLAVSGLDPGSHLVSGNTLAEG